MRDLWSLLPYAAAGLAMIAVGVLAVIAWQRIARERFSYLWIGAALWAVAVALKLGFALLTNPTVFGFLKPRLPYPVLVGAGGFYIGVQSSIFEMGCTLAAVLIWRNFGQNARSAISIGVGAGALEALLLGLVQVAAIAAWGSGLHGTEKIGDALKAQAAATPLLCLAPPVERVIAILVHTSTRALILLGTTHRKPLMVFWGFLIFSLIDGVAGAAHLSGKMGSFSMWWIELAILPFALVSIPILLWCWRRWPAPESPRLQPPIQPSQAPPPTAPSGPG